MPNENENLFFLAQDFYSLNALRDTLEGTGYAVLRNNSFSATLWACQKQSGCVIVSGTDFSFEQLATFQHEFRQEGLPHAFLITEQKPQLERARTLFKIPVQDYFAWSIERPSLMEILENAFEWSRAQARRLSVLHRLRQTFAALDLPSQNVLRQLYCGAVSNQQIAETLACSLRTIEGRRAKLLQTFGVTSLAELIRVATLLWDEEVLPKSCQDFLGLPTQDPDSHPGDFS